MGWGFCNAQRNVAGLKKNVFFVCLFVVLLLLLLFLLFFCWLILFFLLFFWSGGGLSFVKEADDFYRRGLGLARHVESQGRFRASAATRGKEKRAHDGPPPPKGARFAYTQRPGTAHNGWVHKQSRHKYIEGRRQMGARGGGRGVWEGRVGVRQGEEPKNVGDSFGSEFVFVRVRSVNEGGGVGREGVVFLLLLVWFRASSLKCIYVHI